MKHILKVLFILSIAFILNIGLSNSNRIEALSIDQSALANIQGSQDVSATSANIQATSGLLDFNNRLSNLDVVIFTMIGVTGLYYFRTKNKNKRRDYLKASLLDNKGFDLEKIEKERKMLHEK